MKEKKRAELWLGLSLLAAFAVWTVLVRTVDVQPIGPNGSSVGFSTVNGAVKRLVGSRPLLYVITDWLGLVPIATALGFAVLGLVQWMRRGRVRLVDRDVLALGVLYLAVVAVYCFFEVVPVNYRPILIDGVLEVSYPSSTTLITLSVMPTAAMQIRWRLRRRWLRRLGTVALFAFSVFTVAARLFSGVHWVTDIIGACLLCAGLVTLYGASCRCE